MGKTLMIDNKIYKEANSILKELGLDFENAIEIFAKQVILKQGLPFEVTLTQKGFISKDDFKFLPVSKNIPNKQTEKILKEPISEMQSFNTINDLKDILNAE